MSFNVSNTTFNFSDPNQYSAPANQLIVTANNTSTSGFDIANLVWNFWNTVIPQPLATIVLLVVPFVMAWNRQNGVQLVSIVYLFSVPVIYFAVPAFMGQWIYWAIAFAVIIPLVKRFFPNWA